MPLNNAGITLKPKFQFITLKFVTRSVCGYLDGPCCLLTTTGAAQRNAQSTVQPQHPSPQNPKNFKVDFRKKYGSYGALDRPKFLRKLCSFVRSYLRPWGPKTLGSEKSLNFPYRTWGSPVCEDVRALCGMSIDADITMLARGGWWRDTVRPLMMRQGGAISSRTTL